MDLLSLALMDAPSLRPGYCVVCGRPYPTGHHVVRRSRGGHDGPIIDLCGHGTAGCHGHAEALRLHFRYREGWEFLNTSRPLKYAEALELPGWRACSSGEVDVC